MSCPTKPPDGSAIGARVRDRSPAAPRSQPSWREEAHGADERGELPATLTAHHAGKPFGYFLISMAPSRTANRDGKDLNGSQVCELPSTLVATTL